MVILSSTNLGEMALGLREKILEFERMSPDEVHHLRRTLGGLRSRICGGTGPGGVYKSPVDGELVGPLAELAWRTMPGKELAPADSFLGAYDFLFENGIRLTRTVFHYNKHKKEISEQFKYLVTIGFYDDPFRKRMPDESYTVNDGAELIA